MGRPQKVTVEYFSHDTNASSGRTLFILQNKYGNDGYAFWFKLLELLGRTEGHFYSCNNPSEWEYLLAITHVSNDIGNSIIQTLLELESIDSDLYKTSKIIWCQNFVDRLKDVYSRRDKQPHKPVSLVVNANNNPDDTTFTNHDVSNNPQSKLKETKVNKTKVNDDNNNFDDYVKILSQEFNDINVTEELKRFNLYWSESTKKLKRPKLAFRKWLVNSRKFKLEHGNNGHKTAFVDKPIEGITVDNGLGDDTNV